MAATTVLLADTDIALEGPGDPVLAETLRELLITAALCNNAVLQRDADSESDGVGDPTEVALLVAASQYDIWREELVAQAPEVYEDPFDPDSKRMATVHKRSSDYKVAVKGAPEVILSSCSAVHTSDGVVALDDLERQRWLGRVEHLCGRGLRTIALADKAADVVDMDPYNNLILQGVVGLEDPPREGVENAIGRYRDAGVLVVMVTGDHAETARNIASQIGIIDESTDTRQFLGGEAVDRLLEEKRFDELTAVRVFSRVTPEQKLKLISLYQKQNHVVAMTGDGVNDAPALKKADIGVAMGIRGTPVAKEAADMVLQDDDFGTIVLAIGHGRAIFENIRKFVVYLMSCNTSEVLVVALATIAGAPLPLLPLQILFLNLVTDVFPALALGVGPGRSSLMKSKPRPSSERILMRRHWVEIGVYGVIMALAVLSAMAVALLYLGFDQERAVTVAFCTLALAQLWHVFNMRGNLKHVINNEITGNIWIWLALALCMILILAAVYAPVLQDVMKLSDPGSAGWVVIVVGSLVPLVAAPVVRWIANMHTVQAAR
jgi:Ca2+-transporting ATPase